MDITVLTAIACVLVTLIIAVTFIFTRKKSSKFVFYFFVLVNVT